MQLFGGGSISLDGEQFVFVAMEFVEGNDLTFLIGPERRFDDATIRRMLRQLHQAASFLLGEGLCHRDIKPANIRIRPDGDVVLLDLGVLRPIGPSDLTDDARGKRFVGTRRYTPPEMQHRTHKDDAAAYEAITVYQIGAVLYEMIQGAKLFAHVHDQPPADLVSAVDSSKPELLRADVGADLILLVTVRRSTS